MLETEFENNILVDNSSTIKNDGTENKLFLSDGDILIYDFAINCNKSQRKAKCQN